jgi:uncharacterized damage-inducible protein DinB
MVDSIDATPEARSSLAQQAVEVLRRERAETLSALLGLSESDVTERIDWRGTPQSVNIRLQLFSGHLIDHQQHLLKLLAARGRTISTAEYMFMKAAAELAQFEVLCLALSDADFTATGPVEGDWSAQQIIEHVTSTERAYRERLLAGLTAARAARAGSATS